MAKAGLWAGRWQEGGAKAGGLREGETGVSSKGETIPRGRRVCCVSDLSRARAHAHARRRRCQRAVHTFRSTPDGGTVTGERCVLCVVSARTKVLQQEEEEEG